MSERTKPFWLRWMDWLAGVSEPPPPGWIDEQLRSRTTPVVVASHPTGEAKGRDRPASASAWTWQLHKEHKERAALGDTPDE